MKPNNVIYLKCDGDSFYRMWVEFLTPYHKLTSREKDVAARILAQYFYIKEKGVSDPEAIKEIMWTKTSRKAMMDSLKMSQPHFQMILGKLRANKVLTQDNTISPRFIPHKTEEPRFALQVIYDWSSSVKPIKDDKEQAE